MVLDDAAGGVGVGRAEIPHFRRNVPNVPDIPAGVLVASVSGLAPQLGTHEDDMPLRLESVLRDRLLDVGLLELLPLLALEGPPLSVLEVGVEVDALLAAAAFAIVMAPDDAG